ncbi:hypothetical protein KC19_4G134300 [Ceratodon purpureus]|uniref:TOG domain-containing protein n=1 Tax=Ceratodon purpureus TaxID=3225 RepID=A0A8T0IA84_CERPU|nr:hypothetical protein KC19_4G134300 [Ceratodon purpureus]
MEMESKKASVVDIWNDLKKDEAIRNTQKSAARTKVDWNSYHIRDAIKPKKKFYPADRSFDSHLADYSLMEAAHLFRNSEGTLEVGCPYECRDRCRSFKREESNEVSREKSAVLGGGDRQPDPVVSQYAKLKAAYQEKLRKEKLESLASCVEQMKEDIVAAEVTGEDDSVRKLPTGEKEKREPDDGEGDGRLNDEALSRSALLTGAHVSDEVGERLEAEDMASGAAVDEDSKDGEQFLATNSEQAKGLVAEQDGSELVKVAPSSESRSVRFALPEEEARDPAGTGNVNSGDDAEHQSLANALNRDLNSLTDAVAGVRLAALERLQSTLFGSAVEVLEIGSYAQNGGEKRSRSKEESRRHSLGWAAEELVIKPLLRRFGDPSEKCRILAISILHKLLFEVPSAVIVLLPYILPVIGERMPLKVPLGPTSDEDELLKDPPKIQALLVEPSEEVRLQLVQFMRSLLKQAPRLIQAFASDVTSILVAGTFDTHPDVLMEAFAALELLGEIMEYRLKPVGKQLVRVCHRSLSHNHSRVRVAALKAICRLTMCGAHDAIYELTAYRDPNLVPIKAFYEPCPKTQYLAMLTTDKNPVVREELYRTVARWLRELGERKEHECRLLPYLLTGFQDSCPHLQTLAFELMEGVGLQYEEENENEVKDTRTYLSDEFIDDIVSVCGTPLPHPFQKRPCLGARIMVTSVAAILVHAISMDIECWTTGTKELAAHFLLTLLLFVESNITMHLQPLLKIMHKGIAEPSISDKILESARVLGFFVDPSSYLPLMMPLIQGDVSADVSVNTLGNALQLLAGILVGSRPEQITPHIPEICSTLTDRHIMTSIQQTVNDGVVAVAEQLIRAWDAEACAQEVSAMLWLLLNAAAAADFCSRSPQKAECAIEALASASGNELAEKLIALYVDEILEILPHPRKWALRSLDALVFCRVLQSSPLVDEEALNKLIKSFNNCIKKAADDDVKFRLIKAVDELLTKGQFHWAHGKKHIGDMWESLLVPCLEQEDTLIPPTLDAIVSIWSQSFPKEMTSKHQFHDTEQALIRAIEKILRKRSGEDQEVATNEECTQEKLQEEKKFKEFVKKATLPPSDEPIKDPIQVKCMETVTFMLGRSAKRFDGGR